MRKKIAVFANENISYYLLKELKAKKIKVDLLFTSTIKRKKKISDWIDLSKKKKELGIPEIIKINSPNNTLVQKKLTKLNPDYILIMSWSQIIKKKTLDIPKYGAISFHYSNLPKRRGGAPLFWTLFDGLKKLGITIYFMDEGIDDGDIISQTNVKISNNETVKTLLKKIYKIFPKFYVKTIIQILNRKNKRVKQNSKLATYTKARKPLDGLISFKMKKKKIIRFVNALTEPYPCAFFYATDFNGEKKTFKILEANLMNKKTYFKGYLD